MYEECPQPIKGQCWRCFKPLVGRQQKYCSEECSNEYYWNHMWGGARHHALVVHGKKCKRCGFPGKDWFNPLEVNHIDPIMGKHHKNGCWHHQENLNVLCHGCHVDETNRQFSHGKYRPVLQLPLA